MISEDSEDSEYSEDSEDSENSDYSENSENSDYSDYSENSDYLLRIVPQMVKKVSLFFILLHYLCSQNTVSFHDRTRNRITPKGRIAIILPFSFLPTPFGKESHKMQKNAEKCLFFFGFMYLCTVLIEN